MDDLTSYIKKGSLIIFNVTAIVGVIGYILDILNFNNTSNSIIYNNILLITITIIAFFLYHSKKLNLRISYLIIVYAAIANVLYSDFKDISIEFNLYFFLRDSIFIIIIMSLASLVSGKYHALIISAIYSTSAVIYNLIIKNDFLQSSIIMLILYVLAYSVVVFFFVDILEKSIIDRGKKEKMIYDQNTSLSEVNGILEESQQKIEEQTAELKSVNDQLNATNEKLNELNAMKDKFISIIGHDLKNPVNVITGFSDMLKIKINNLSVKKRDMYIENINSTAKKTYNLLENLLDWARSQSGRMIMDPKNTNLIQLINANIILLSEQAREKEIKILTDFPEVPAIVFSDSNMIDTVIRNLLNNTVKFTNSGGEVLVKVSIDKKSGQVKTVITDTGIGIPANIINKLFSIDRSYSSEGTAGETGTGLGLILCKEFIEKNNGKIWVESVEDKGSTFTFTLPLVKE